MMIDNQTRLLEEKVSLRASDTGDVVEFYASVFNRESKLLSEDGKMFREVILPGAFDEVLQRSDLNTLAVVDHDKGQMLARTRSGTLTLEVDERGLKASFVIPDTTLGRDTKELIRRGDIDESSFKFSVLEKDVRYERENGTLIRYISRIHRLMDVSLIRGDGAYADTSVSLRGFEEFEEKESELQAKRKREELDNYYNNLKSRLDDN